ncbi:MAG: DUF1800 domain-containing protein [Thermoflexibacteraceae bacterium]
MADNKYIQTQHLYLRAAFGETVATIAEKADKKPKKLVKELFEQAAISKDLIVMKENPLSTEELMEMSKEEKQELRKESKDKIKELNLLWLDRMADSQAAFREKMTLFWHGHFACQSANVFFVQQQNNAIRKNALGKFGDLLTAVSKSAAMLEFLNNKQNRKDSPNENFAREVMELFTLGRGNYTENDIKNAAKAFTGWSYDEDGTFRLRQRQHDEGQKTFMGKTGNFSGEDILQLLLENPQTAVFITTKIYKYFVNEKPNEQIIKGLAEKFYSSGYDIGALMEEIFMADWFYAPENIGTRIKSPVELLVGLRKQLGLTFQDREAQLLVQKVLGQVLFFPPNVAGWKEGNSWIDSSTLMIRLLLVGVLSKEGATWQAKQDGDVNTDFFAKKRLINIKGTFDLTAFQQVFAKTNPKNLVEEMANYLLQTPLVGNNQKLLQLKAQTTSPAEFINSTALALASLPEYQLA